MSKNRFECNMEGLDCANCAVKIEDKINNLEGVKIAKLNFITKKLDVEIEDEHSKEKVFNNIKILVNKMEDGIVLTQNEIINKNNLDIIKLGKIIISSVLLIFGFFIEDKLFQLMIFGISYSIVGFEILKLSFKNILRGKIFDENFLMSIATIGAFILGEYQEGITVMIFYQIGEYFQSLAVNKSRRSIENLLNLKPEYANIIHNDEIIKSKPEDVKINDIILIKQGEKIPLDGVIVEGSSLVDNSSLTGESIPLEVEIGENVLAGGINVSNVLKVKVTNDYSNSTISKILDLVQNSPSNKAKTEKFITKFANYYTPIVVFLALIIAIFPPLIFSEEFGKWGYRALVFLVISCPCALVLSIPISFFGGIGLASKNGILIKGANYLEALNNVKTIVFDKTGTLTTGKLKISKIESTSNLKDDELLKIAAYAEFYSNHPIAKTIGHHYKSEIDLNSISNFEQLQGRGVKLTLDGENILAGNKKLMEENNIKINTINEFKTILYICVNNELKGYITFNDEVRKETENMVIYLKSEGIDIKILSGDNFNSTKFIADKLKIKEFYCELLPNDKLNKLIEIQKKSSVAFVGDGINDAPSLSKVDIGISLGGIGTDAAIEASDIVIMNDDITKISQAIKISKLTKNIIWQNITLAFSVKLIVLILGTGGLASMWEAVFADVGVAILAILNSTRLISKKV